MSKFNKIVTFGLAACMIIFTGCSKKGDNTAETAPSASVIEEKDYLQMQTSIAYSSGDTKNWTYGNQRKEFPNHESCYVRIGCTAITNSFWGKGNGDEITVTYRFTGTNNCKVEVSDGIAELHETGDENITEFSHTITAAKEKKAQEDIMIFRYSPKDAESVVLEIIYDDQIAEKFDQFNTIYFDQTPNRQNGTH